MKTPIKIAISEVHDLYPSLLQRGLTADKLELLVEWDVIGGIPSDSNNECYMFKDALEVFIKYHNDYYKNRIGAINEGIKSFKKKNNKVTKDSQEIDNLGESE